MAVGLRIRNAYGSVQVDERYSGMGCTAWGTVTLTTPSSSHPNPMKTGSVTVTGTNPLLAIASAYPVNLVRITQSGSSWTFHLRCQVSQNISVSYWVFDNADLVPRPPSGSVGVIVRHPSTGKIVFHSNMKPLRLVQVLNLSGREQVTVPGGRAYAVIQGASYMFNSQIKSDMPTTIPPPGYDIYQNIAEYSASVVNGNVITAGNYVFERYENQLPIGTADFSSTRGNLSFWIVDVTGYGGAIPSADYTPNAVNWANISGTTTSNTLTNQNASQTISGIDQTITLRVSVSGVSGNLSSGTLYLRNSSGTVLGSRSFTSPGSFEVNVGNNTGLYFTADASTTSGIRSGSATVTVQNMSDQGLTLDTFTINQTVDSDNNYNVSTDDFVPNAVNWTNVNASDPNSVGYSEATGNSQTISGINKTITLRLSVPQFYMESWGSSSPSGTVILAVMVNNVQRTKVERSYFGSGSNTASQSTTFTVNNGDVVKFTVICSYGGFGEGSTGGGGVAQIINESSGNTVLDTFEFAGTAGLVDRGGGPGDPPIIE